MRPLKSNPGCPGHWTWLGLSAGWFCPDHNDQYNCCHNYGPAAGLSSAGSIGWLPGRWSHVAIWIYARVSIPHQNHIQHTKKSSFLPFPLSTFFTTFPPYAVLVFSQINHLFWHKHATWVRCWRYGNISTPLANYQAKSFTLVWPPNGREWE